jgi:8-oxo-dGTP diphosphatase
MSSSFPRVGVSALVVFQKKILLGYRVTTHGNGYWGFPGGHLDYGETPEACATREAWEEYRLKLRNVSLYTVSNDVFLETNKHYITLHMRAEVDDPKVINVEPDKHQDWQWFSWTDLPQPLFLPITNILKQNLAPPEGL